MIRAAWPEGPLSWTLVLFLAVLAVQRAAELVHSAGNTRRLIARGAVEHAAGHYPLLVAIHVLFPLLLVAEVVVLGTRPNATWPFWLVLWLAAQVLRVVAIRTLGERWTVRILVLPAQPRVRSGPYRLIPHPNYLAVVIELLAAPLMFGAWRTAVVISLLDAVGLRIRIRAEERALSPERGAVSSAAGPPPGGRPARGR